MLTPMWWQMASKCSVIFRCLGHPEYPRAVFHWQYLRSPCPVQFATGICYNLRPLRIFCADDCCSLKFYKLTFVNESAGFDFTRPTYYPVVDSKGKNMDSPAAPRVKSVSYDCLLKFLLIGDPGVGKTSIAVRFADDTFTDSYIATVGIDFQVRVVPLTNGKNAKLQVWDTAGQERYHAMTSSYYKSAHGVMLVFDVTKITSFETMTSWLRKIRDSAPSNVVVMLVGNKCETPFRHRQVPQSVAKKFAAQHGLLYAEVSAMDNSNIDEAFTHLADACWQRLQEAAKTTDERNRPKVFLNAATANSSFARGRCCLK